MSRETYRIALDDFEQGAWVDIHCHRTAGERAEVNEAVAAGQVAWERKQAELYIVAWEGDFTEGASPSAGAYMNLEEHIGERILSEAFLHYQSHAPSEEAGKA